MTSVNVVPLQFSDKENDVAIKSRNLIIVAVLFLISIADYFLEIIIFCCLGALFPWQHQYFMNIR